MFRRKPFSHALFRRIPWLAVLSVGLLTMTLGGVEDRYPSRPITIVCPWSTGGGTDAVSRQIAAYLEADLQVPVTVVNATGGSGVTGHSTGARARPDGYTVTMMTVELNMLHWRGLTKITPDDFEPLFLLNRDAAAIFVRADAPWASARELLEAIRARPGEIRASGTAAGGIWHLALAGWLVSSGLDAGAVRWIPNSGAGPSLTELMSRGIEVVCCSVPEARNYLGDGASTGGSARCLGVLSERPVRGFEHLPLFSSLGFDWTLGGWRGLGVPRGTPPEIVAALRSSIGRIVRGETKLVGISFVEFLDRQGFDANWADADEFRRILADTDRALGELLLSPGFQRLHDHDLPAYAFPGALAVVFSVAIIALVVEKRRATRRESANSTKTSILSGAWGRVAELFGAVVAYIVLAEPIGFVAAAGAIVAFLAWRWGTALVRSIDLGVAAAAVIFLIFAIGLRVPLPRGPVGW
jgi:tripartite-type tricarboxylate transporter receptor subunit TctC